MAGEWTTFRLGDVCSKVGSGATPRGGSSVYLDKGEVALIRSQNIYNDGFHHDGIVYLTQEHAAELENVEVAAHDVLLNITGDSVARSCQVDPHVLPARVNQHVAIVRPDPTVLWPQFLRYALISPDMQAEMLSLAGAGATRNALTKGMIESFEVLAPRDVNEQRAIADILGTLDNKIELNRQMNETLEAMVRSLFESWFVDFDPVRAKAEGRAPNLPKPVADLFPSSLIQCELGDIPEGWGLAPLGELVDVARGLSYKGSGLSDDGVPMHNLNSIYEGGGYKHDGLKRYNGEYRPQHLACAGDVIVANTEQGHDRLLIGYAAIVPRSFMNDSLFSHHIYRIRPKSTSGLTSDYLCQLLNLSAIHDIVSGYANGTTVNMMPLDALQKPQIVVPPAHLVAAFSGFAEALRIRREHMVQESSTLVGLRASLLPRLISGELQVFDAGHFLERSGT